MGGPHPTLTAAPTGPGSATAGPRHAPWVDAEPRAVHVVAAAGLLLVAVGAVEIALRGTLGLGVGVCLVLVSVATALLVRARDLFTAAVLPPLLLVVLLVLVALAQPDGIAVPVVSSASVAQHVIAGFVDLAGALVVAHGLTLTVVALRARVARRKGHGSRDIRAAGATAMSRDP